MHLLDITKAQIVHSPSLEHHLKRAIRLYIKAVKLNKNGQGLHHQIILALLITHLVA